MMTSAKSRALHFAPTVLALCSLVFTGCTSTRIPANQAETMTAGNLYMAEWASSYRDGDLPQGFADMQNANQCETAPLPAPFASVPAADPAQLSASPVLAPGDFLNVVIEDDDLFSSRALVHSDGTLALRGLPPLPVSGLGPTVAADRIAQALVAADIYRPGYASVSVTVQNWAAVDVSVSGAVFQPGQKTMNDLPADSIDQTKLDAPGDAPKQRTLSAALRSAAGVRPDADLEHVILIRGGQRFEINLRAAVDGGRMVDPFLNNGDHIFVPSRRCFDKTLVRPSPVTPPGIRVFLSNLSVPTQANAVSAVGKYSNELPYGTTMFQAAFSANCMGGTQITNAGRFAILASTDPLTGEQIVVQRALEDLARRKDRREFNPILLPGDSMACYDSVVTNIRDVIATFGEAAGPSLLAIGVLGASQ